MTISPVFAIAVAVSGVLGAIGGSAFHWSAPEQAWNIFIATFLWTLIAAAGTTIGRFAGERLRRGHWRRGLWLSHVQSFPLTTVFLAIAVPVSSGAALIPSVIPILYTCTLVVALALAALGVLTSPFTRP